MVAGASKGQSLHPSGCKSYVVAHYTQDQDEKATSALYRMPPLADQRLWAPWRLEYITGEKSDECIFCAKPRLDDEAALIVRRGDRCFVMLNAFPYTSGHVMVAPYGHGADLTDLDEATSLELVSLTQEALRAIEDAYGPAGYNVGANLGTVAGAGVADHVHLHVVPRWEGDTNFMPVIGDVRVLPESLDDTRRKLKAAFARLESAS
jgi:ATP adenylyltransferase